MSKNRGGRVALVGAFQVQLTRHEGVAARGVEQQTRREASRHPVLIDRIDTGARSAFTEGDRCHLCTFANPATFAPRIGEQQVVEHRSLNSVAVGVVTVKAQGELIGNALPGFVRNEFGTWLDHANRGHFMVEAKAIEDWQVAREQRFTYMEPRVRSLFKEYDVPSLICDQRSGGEPAGPPPITRTSQGSASLAVGVIQDVERAVNLSKLGRNRLIILMNRNGETRMFHLYRPGENGMLKCFLSPGLLIITLSSVAQARNTRYTLKVQDVLNSSDYQQKVGNAVAFYFANQPAPKAAHELGEYVTNKKTNSFGKSDESACQWAMLSAFIQLRDRALQEGGNAVINVVSCYDKNEIPDKSEYECHAGAVIAGVALKGTVVKLAK